MKLPIHQLDAFTRRQFGGNPAAVVPLSSWLPDSLMQAIALSNNLSETAFFVPAEPERADYELRWFTPAVEVDLCGHATLATAWWILNELRPAAESVSFATRSGLLTVRRDGEQLAMDFPTNPPAPCDPCPGLIDAMGRAPKEVWGSTKYLLVYEDATEVAALRPTMAGLMDIDRDGVVATAPAASEDPWHVVCRYFVPAAGIDEDPATGSAQTVLGPFWSARLGRQRFASRQISARGGEFDLELVDDRIVIRGRAVPYMSGQLELDLSLWSDE